MTYGNSGTDRPSKNERRDAAREKARVLREEHRRKEKRGKMFLQGGVILGTLAIIAIVALVIVNSTKPPAAGPRNMLSDGIQISQGFVATPTAALQPGSSPVPNVRDAKSDVIQIQIVVDYLCPVCGTFEKTNAEQISSWVDSGAATVEIFPISILDRLSQGAKYSTRAANAAACVADNSPDQFYDFSALLFANQPKEQSTGLSDDELIALTAEAKVKNASAIKKCITDQQFSGWVADSFGRLAATGIANSNVKSVTGTPTVIVNGVQYTGAVNDAAAFSAFVVQAASASFNENATPTPTPTATP